jgi:hypothetical protein
MGKILKSDMEWIIKRRDGDFEGNAMNALVPSGF